MSTMSSSPIAPRGAAFLVKFDNTLGALVIGGLIGMALWGITSVQAYNYFMHVKNRDRPPLKLTVAALWLLDTLDSCMSCHTLYFYLVSNYGNILALLTPVWSIVYRIALTSIINFMIRSLFAVRVYRLSKGNIYLTGWVALISSAQLAVGIVVTVKVHNKTFIELTDLRDLFYALFGLATASDLSVTTILGYLLYRSRTGYVKTDNVIKILMAYTVNTGFVVAVDATVSMISFITMPDNFIFIAFYLLISKRELAASLLIFSMIPGHAFVLFTVYVNSYLATMNAREVLRNKAEASFQLSGGGASTLRRDVEDNANYPGSSYLNLKPTPGSHTMSPSRAIELSIFPYAGS